MMNKSRRQKPGVRSQKDKAEARNHETEEKRTESINVVSALYSGSWLLAPDSCFSPFIIQRSAFIIFISSYCCQAESAVGAHAFD
jgi:hypothetical protein